jgi:hypothetical protein
VSSIAQLITGFQRRGDVTNVAQNACRRESLYEASAEVAILSNIRNNHHHEAELIRVKEATR